MKTTRDLEETRDVLNEARMSLNVLLRKKIDIPFLNLVNDAILKRLAQIDGEINTIKNSCDHNWGGTALVIMMMLTNVLSVAKLSGGN